MPAKQRNTHANYLGEFESVCRERELTDDDRKHVVSFVDYTLLTGKLTAAEALEWARTGHRPVSGKSWGPVAGLCTWPQLMPEVRAAIDETDPTIAAVAVAGDFPAGACSDTMVAMQTAGAVDAGADEVDIVINHDKLRVSKNLEDVRARTSVACEIAHERGALVKVILETGNLGSAGLTYSAAKAACEAGADFVKTSTGFDYPGADHNSFAAMARAVADHHESTGRMVGLKASGGIGSFEAADVYLRLAEAIAGPQWADPTLMRIGASGLLSSAGSVDILPSLRFA